MTGRYENTDEFRGATFNGVDLSAATFRDCDLRQVRVVDSWLGDLSLSGELGSIVINEVEVSDYVSGELDRRHPERVQLRAARTPDELRAMWATIVNLWADTTDRFEQLSEADRARSVGDEWSLVDTMRHLVFATDAWLGSTVLDLATPYHRLGLPSSGYPADAAAAIGLELTATPTYAEVLEARRSRMALVAQLLDGITEAELERSSSRPPSPSYPHEPRTVRRCLGVVMREECEHRLYMERDLSTLTAPPA